MFVYSRTSGWRRSRRSRHQPLTQPAFRGSCRSLYCLQIEENLYLDGLTLGFGTVFLFPFDELVGPIVSSMRSMSATIARNLSLATSPSLLIVRSWSTRSGEIELVPMFQQGKPEDVVTNGLTADSAHESAIVREDEPILSLPFYNPQRTACPGCGREVKGRVMESAPSILDD